MEEKQGKLNNSLAALRLESENQASDDSESWLNQFLCKPHTTHVASRKNLSGYIRCQKKSGVGPDRGPGTKPMNP